MAPNSLGYKHAQQANDQILSELQATIPSHHRQQSGSSRSLDSLAQSGSGGLRHSPDLLVRPEGERDRRSRLLDSATPGGYISRSLDSAAPRDYTSRTFDSAAPGGYISRSLDSAAPRGYTSRPFDSAAPRGYTSRPFDSAAPGGYISRSLDSAAPRGYTSRPFDSAAPGGYTSRPFNSPAPGDYVSRPLDSAAPGGYISRSFDSNASGDTDFYSFDSATPSDNDSRYSDSAQSRDNDSPSKGKNFFLAWLTIAACCLLLYNLSRSSSAIAPPVHVSKNPNLIAPRGQMKNVTRLLWRMPLTIVEILGGDMFVPIHRPFDDYDQLMALDKFNLTTRVIDVDMKLNELTLSLKYRRNQRHGWQWIKDWECQDLIRLQQRSILYSNERHALDQLDCSKLGWRSAWSKLLCSLYLTPEPLAVRRAYLRALEITYQYLIRDFPANRNAFLPILRDLRDVEFYHLFGAIYLLLEDIAKIHSKASLHEQQTLVREHAPLLVYLRQVEGRCLIYHAALTVMIAHLEVGLAIFRAADKNVAQNLLETFQLDTSQMNSNGSDKVVDLASAAALWNQSVVDDNDFFNASMYTKMSLTLDYHLEIMDELHHNGFYQVSRKVLRRWAIERFEHCLAKDDNATEGFFTQSAMLAPRSFPPEATALLPVFTNPIDTTGVGTSSHRLPLLRWWFSDWDSGIMFKPDVPDWPGIFDDLRRPRQANGRRVPVDTSTPEICFTFLDMTTLSRQRLPAEEEILACV